MIARRLSLIAFALLAACAWQPKDQAILQIPLGTPYEAVQTKLAGKEIFARACEERVYFPGLDDAHVQDCGRRQKFSDIYRDAKWHYVVRYEAGRVVQVSATDHTFPWT